MKESHWNQSLIVKRCTQDLTFKNEDEIKQGLILLVLYDL